MQSISYFTRNSSSVTPSKLQGKTKLSSFDSLLVQTTTKETPMVIVACICCEVRARGENIAQEGHPTKMPMIYYSKRTKEIRTFIDSLLTSSSDTHIHTCTHAHTQNAGELHVRGPEAHRQDNVRRLSSPSLPHCRPLLV